MIPLLALNTNNIQALVYSSKTESELAASLGSGSVLFSNQQVALESCLESLGVGLYNTPVILSALAPSWFVAAILRTGGLPVCIDSGHWSGSLSVDALTQATTDLEECVILHWRPNGFSLGVSLENINLDYVAIDISDSLPTSTTVTETCKFSIHSLVPACDSGAVVHSRHPDSQKILSQIKSGVLGRGDKFIANYGQTARLLKDFQSTADVGVARKFTENPVFSKHILHFGSMYLPMRVKNAVACKNDLYMAGYESGLGAIDVTTIPEIRARYTKEVPFYENADKHHNTIINLPCHSGITDYDITNIERVVKHYTRGI